MVFTSLTGLLTLTVAVSGNFWGSPFPNFPNFPPFPSFPSDGGFAGQSTSFPGFNSFQPSFPSFPSFGSPNGFGGGGSAFGSSSSSSSSSDNLGNNNVIQTIKLEKDGPDGSKITETIQMDGGPNGGSSVKINRQSSSSSNGNPVNVVHYFGGDNSPSSSSPTQGIAIGEPNPSVPMPNDQDSTSSGFPSFNDFSGSFDSFNNGFFPSSAGISTASSSSSNSNFVTSSSTKTNPDGSTVTETVTYDSKNPGKVTRVIKRIDANGKVTTTTL